MIKLTLWYLRLWFSNLFLYWGLWTIRFGYWLTMVSFKMSGLVDLIKVARENRPASTVLDAEHVKRYMENVQ